MFYAGKIPGTRLAELKAKYVLIHDTLESELQLLQDAKRFTVKLEEQQEVLEKAEQFPESATSEVSKLRQQYLRYFNEYNAIQEREFEIQYKLNRDIEKRKILLREEAQELTEMSKKMEAKCVEAMEEKEDAVKEVEGKKALLEIKEREFNTQSKVHEMNKENEGTAISERGVLEMGFRNVTNLKQKLHDALSRLQREKEKDFRTFKKMEMQLKITQESLIQVQSHHERMLLELDAATSKDDGAILERRRELQREVEMAKRNLTQEGYHIPVPLSTIFPFCFGHQVRGVEILVRTLEQCIAEEDQLIHAQEHCREEFNNLIRMTQLKADEREQKSKDFLKAQQRLNNIIAEIKTKDFEIREHTKKRREIHRQMKEFAKLSGIVLSEKKQVGEHCTLRSPENK
ncbi:hypothetical protein E2320_005882 [Naja naja]|nr:hypothetical protein E2320_005882 [Naja naja]